LNRRALIWVIISLVLPVVILLIMQQLFDIDKSQFFDVMKTLSDSPWAIPITIFLFCIMAFIGAPQWMLITGTILAFGPWQGGCLSWLGSMAAAMLGFALGHYVGAERMQKLDAKLIQKLSAAVRRNGFMTSLVVRLVPTGPAILVNLAAGVSKMKFSHFLGGTAIGILPKIIVVALISQGFMSGLSGSWRAMFFAGLAGLAILLSWLARKRLEAQSPI